jgi:hypothetical protein
MSNFIRTLGFTTIALVGLSAQAGDFTPLMNVARSTWPEKSTIGVFCDYTQSAKEVQELAQASGPGSFIQVVDIQRRDQLFEAMRCMLNHKPDYVVLLARDRVVPDYSTEATRMVRLLASHGVPTISTSSVALKQGAVFALGERTKGELMVCAQPIGTISVTLPLKDTQPRLATPAISPARIQVAELR